MLFQLWFFNFTEIFFRLVDLQYPIFQTNFPVSLKSKSLIALDPPFEINYRS